ncbi:NAD(P)H-hydrate epimerase [Buchananella hordeovulneris]|uniref:NAD(P)H-hydrate epimerase n=1 Tax=Buchananella hordeovulneris TaxID=52770 RepID=UPI0026DCB39A|nr:NAD(P)H-hydrate epimerase [Buchananella hordeovulneris]MDO5080210.1 NAD(P)H-hydrate epimerase [Buchananella hordeovulneris]
MRAAWRAAAVRAAEAPLVASAPPDHWMRAAAWAVARAAKAQARSRTGRVVGHRALVLVGGGANGGDGLYAAALLARSGWLVTAVLATAHPHAPALAAARTAGVQVALAPSLPATAGLRPLGSARLRAVAAASPIWLDALTGTGARGPLRGPAAALVHELLPVRADTQPRVVAVDVPSGVDVDTGAVAGVVLRADVTVTFGDEKPCLLLPPGCYLAGQVELALPELGVEPTGPAPAVVTQDATELAALWRRPRPTDHKYTRGVVGLLVGSATYPGAGILAAAGALGAAPGMVRLLAADGPGPRPAHVAAQLAAHPALVAAPGRVQARVLGPGGDADQAPAYAAALAAARADGLPLVLDAAALDGLVPPLPPAALLTPHAGELAALLTAWGQPRSRAEVEAAPVAAARAAAQRAGCVVLLKGHTTVIAAPTDPLYVHSGAPAWLATAGTGDVLAGILGAALAAVGDEVAALPGPLASGEVARWASLGVVLHTAAARRCGGPLSASALAAAVPAALAALLAREDGTMGQ